MLNLSKMGKPPDQHRVTTSTPRLDLHKALRPNTVMAPGNQLLLSQSRDGALLQCLHMLSLSKTGRPPDQHRVTTSTPRLDLHKALRPNTVMAPGNQQQLLLSHSRDGALLQCLHMLSLSKTGRPPDQHRVTTSTPRLDFQPVLWPNTLVAPGNQQLLSQSRVAQGLRLRLSLTEFMGHHIQSRAVNKVMLRLGAKGLENAVFE
ncbi:uncharacterized protein LOC116221028 isoform X7 [Clupea harengus]|uniref:Uncharacterized protein LOC116221028 isoform X7 n=1 Tax=Clupea harengus TaxID=7950 RepID=A0A6P8FQN7_CLUHA|nr:uncharacterized protein LOC116221028 isoform X7 [Clupea harengus]